MLDMELLCQWSELSWDEKDGNIFVSRSVINLTIVPAQVYTKTLKFHQGEHGRGGKARTVALKNAEYSWTEYRRAEEVIKAI